MTGTEQPVATTEGSTDGLATIASLDAIKLEPRDQLTLALAFGKTTSAERTARTTPLTDTVGSQETFWVMDIAQDRYYTTTATLRLALDHVLMYVEDGVQFDKAALERSAREFNDKVYPRDRELFGEEWTPGVDGDPRITILNARINGAGGYFGSPDEVTRAVNRFSNEREMFYMNSDDRPLGTPDYAAVLAHEFQHMIEFHQSTQDSTWLNEGLSELAMELNGYGTSGSSGAYIAQPDLQLTDWASEPSASVAHYGAAYLFLSYFYERYKSVADLKQLIKEGAGVHLEAIAAQARKLRPDLASFDQLYSDWAVANLINDPKLEEGRWSYSSLPGTVVPETEVTGPVADEVTQYGSDYLLLPQASTDRTYQFDGSDQIGVVPTNPQGKVSWWSDRGDDAVSNLTGSFDLSKVTKATLQFKTWYDLENDYDYGFLSASVDGGKTWKTLEGSHTTSDDKLGGNYGYGYTGKSGGGEQAEWVDESVDLSAYAGKQIQLRFSVINDDAFNRPGMLVDTLRIPEIGFTDDAEEANSVWQPSGWVRTNNILPQRWQIRLVRYPKNSDEPSKVEAIALDQANRGTIQLAANERGVLVVSATTPHTTEHASYTLAPAGP